MKKRIVLACSIAALTCSVSLCSTQQSISVLIKNWITNKFFAQKTEDEVMAVEQGLRHTILIAGDKIQHMTITERMNYWKTPAVSIAVINKEKLEWVKGYGKITSNSEAKKIDSNFLFQAASISKPVTALGVLLLVQQGKLSLDENVNKYLKSWKVPDNEFTKKEKVTLRRLLSHTAGTNVHGFEGYPEGTSIPSVVEILDGKNPIVNSDPVRVIHTPGEQFCYSGGGATITQLIIEDVTGEKFDTWMKNNILIPFGMIASTFRQPLTQKYSDIAVYGHDSEGMQVDGKWHIYPEMAAAGLWTTPTDLARFLIAIIRTFHGKQTGPVSQKLIKEALQPQNKSNDFSRGLGFSLNGTGNEMSFGHDGQNEGFLAKINVWPELGKGLVIMINNDGARGLIDEIKNSIADKYGLPGFEPVIKNVTKLDPEVGDKYVGTYRLEEGFSFAVTREHNNFFVQATGQPKYQIYPESDTDFFFQEVDAQISFYKDEDGNVAKLILHIGGTDLVAEKIEE
jgi:CubicO group peptidase (beta-lactamase class C family)